MMLTLNMFLGREDMEGMPIGHLCAAAAAFKRGDPIPLDAVEAVDKWRDGIPARREARTKAREVAEMKRLMNKYPEEANDY